MLRADDALAEMDDDRSTPDGWLERIPPANQSPLTSLLRASVESANDAFIITDTELDEPGPRIVYVNPAFSKMTGYAAAEVVGRSPRVLQGPRTDRQLLHRLRDDLMHGREFHGETVNYRKDGSEYVVEWRITGVRDHTGRVVNWVAVQRDVTDRVRLETQREQALRRERVAREQAEQAGRVKEDFLATLSHELRTPLNALSNYAQALLRDGGRLSEDERQRSIESIVRASEVQRRLVDDLLDMSAITSGRLQLVRAPCDLAAVGQAAFETVRPAIKAKGIRFELRIQPDLPGFPCDAVRMQQVIWNLLNNAVRHARPSGRVWMALSREGDTLTIEVGDDGDGIDPELLPTLFERFRQADNSITRVHGGLGIGLTISRHLVEMHGGTIEGHSDGPGLGARFTVRLPLAPDDAPERVEDPDAGTA